MRQYKLVLNIDAPEEVPPQAILYLFAIKATQAELEGLEIGIAEFGTRNELDVNIQPEQTTLEETES